MSRDLDTSRVDFVQFTAQVGGDGSRGAVRCFGAERRAESVLLLYSNDAGITWALITEMQSTDYQLPR